MSTENTTITEKEQAKLNKQAAKFEAIATTYGYKLGSKEYESLKAEYIMRTNCPPMAAAKNWKDRVYDVGTVVAGNGITILIGGLLAYAISSRSSETTEVAETNSNPFADTSSVEASARPLKAAK